ncbi:CBO0543 family protein [Alkalihalobacterium sp. APHAB7]|uniref:CBO0543 family protein n=1 Tax=Alkalihalobacterium sp. APHAB7 TaxID=3402081 RepID=UPI003AADAD97
MNEKKFLNYMFYFGILAIPFVFFRKKPLKDWVIVYFIVGFVSGIIDNILVTRGKLKYPVKKFKNYFLVSCTFDFVLCPLLNVIYNQATYKNNAWQSFLKLFLFITPMSLFETWLEKNTNLIKWKNGWKWYHTYISIFTKYLSVRIIMAIIRYFSNLQQHVFESKSKTGLHNERIE